MDYGTVFLASLLGLIIGVIFILILALIMRWLWNTTLPHVFPGVREIDTVQAIKIMFLAALLFGGNRVFMMQPPPPPEAPPAAATTTTP